MQTLVVAGFGKLGSAIVRGAVAAGVARAAEITVWARSASRQAEAKARSASRVAYEVCIIH